MTDYGSPVPVPVIVEVNDWLDANRRALENFDNVKPLDHGMSLDLHSLARTIYAKGWWDGYIANRETERGTPAPTPTGDKPA